MSQGRPSSLSSRLRYGGAGLRYQHPISGQETFRPSGNPDTDPPERERLSEWDVNRIIFGLDTPEGAAAWDTHLGHSKKSDYWDRLRFKPSKSPRARKRELERDARRGK
jgi:hypothetical protein